MQPQPNTKRSSSLLIALSFVTDLSVGLSVAGLIHAVLGPPPVISGKETHVIGDTSLIFWWVEEISLSWSERLVLLAAAIALIRLLHSYVILNAKPNLRKLLFARGSGFHQTISIATKVILVAGLMYFPYVVSNPASVSGKWLANQFMHVVMDDGQLAHYLKTFKPYEWEAKIGSIAVLSAIFILSLAMYIPLLVSECFTLHFIRNLQTESAERALLKRTFENWIKIDVCAILLFGIQFALIWAAFSGELGVLANGATNEWVPGSIGRLIDRLGKGQVVLFGVTLALTVWDYAWNLSFYGIPPEIRRSRSRNDAVSRPRDDGREPAA
jgi:hypothetical protein